MNNKSFISGIIFICIGLLLLINKLGWLAFSWQVLWPWLVIGSGGLFWSNWLKNREDTSLLLPGTILLTYGLLFLYCNINNQWELMHTKKLWTFFLIGPGLGFFAMYFLGKKDSGLLLAGSIFSGLGVFFLLGQIKFFWPVLLILVGLKLLFDARRQSVIPSKKSSSLPNQDASHQETTTQE